MRSNFFNKVKSMITGGTEVLEKPHTQELLPVPSELMDLAAEYKQLMFFYEAGIELIRTKLQILNREFQCCYDRNPIESIESRVKSAKSILNKLQKMNLPITKNNIISQIHDTAGIRVICPFISDVYQMSNLLIEQDDIQVVEIRDYIKEPKENGYRSLHVIVLVDICFSQQKQKVPVEIQLRTIAMNFWASLDHQLRYKKDYNLTEEMLTELKICAEIMDDADKRMQKLADALEITGINLYNGKSREEMKR